MRRTVNPKHDYSRSDFQVPDVLWIEEGEEPRLMGVFPNGEFSVVRDGEYVVATIDELDDLELVALAAHKLGAK